MRRGMENCMRMGARMSRLTLRGRVLSNVGVRKSRFFAGCGARSRFNDYHGSYKNMSHSALQPGFINRMTLCEGCPKDTDSTALENRATGHCNSLLLVHLSRKVSGRKCPLIASAGFQNLGI